MRGEVELYYKEVDKKFKSLQVKPQKLFFMKNNYRKEIILENMHFFLVKTEKCLLEVSVLLN